MKKYLFTTLPTNDLGLLTRSLPIARELAQRGHAVAFCSPAPAPSRLIAEAGFDNLLPRHALYHLMAAEMSLRGFVRAVRSERARRDVGGFPGFVRQLAPAIPTRLASATAEIWNMDHLGALMGMLNEGFVRANCEALRTLVAEHAPDVVVDFWNPFAGVAARAAGKPLATVIQADMHPASQGFVWWKDPPPDLPSPVPVLNRVLAGYGLDPIRKSGELCVGDLTLVVGTPETDPLPAGARVTYVGSILWQKPGTRLPAWADDLRADRPVVWVYSGNPQYFPVRTPVDSAVVLDACVAALADLDVQVVLTTGHHALPRDVLPLPANFRYEAYVPGLAMAERSDLLIHHGGYGSCQTGLYTGTPAVVIPTFSERESNARRVAALGAGDLVVPTGGSVGGKRRVCVEELRGKVERVLSDPSFTANARRMAQRLRTFGGAPEAARLIEEL